MLAESDLTAKNKRACVHVVSLRRAEYRTLLHNLVPKETIQRLKQAPDWADRRSLDNTFNTIRLGEHLLAMLASSRIVASYRGLLQA